MKSHNFILISCLIFSVSGCKQKPLLTIQDLKFVNVDKNAISQNKIDTTYLLSENIILNYNHSDTFGFDVYDVKGNLVSEWRLKLFGHRVKYEYDSIDLITYKEFNTDFNLSFLVTYKFVQDSALLYQYWSDGEPICLFCFNDKGFLVNSHDYTHSDVGSHGTFSLYEYDSQNKLIRKVEKLQSMTSEQLKLREEYYDKGINTHNITNYFYTGTKMDSLITTYYFHNSPENNYTSKTYYDMRGLRTETILKDTIKTIYLHKTRNF